MLTGVEKGALLLKQLAPPVVESILAQLGPERAPRLRAVMDRLNPSPAMLDEFLIEVAESLNEGPPKLGVWKEPATPAPVPAPPPPSPSAPAPLTPEFIVELK